MHMGVIGQVACPGMKHAYQPDLSAQITRIKCQLLTSLGRSLEKQTIEQALVVSIEIASKLPQIRL